MCFEAVRRHRHLRDRSACQSKGSSPPADSRTNTSQHRSRVTSHQFKSSLCGNAESNTVVDLCLRSTFYVMDLPRSSLENIEIELWRPACGVSGSRAAPTAGGCFERMLRCVRRLIAARCVALILQGKCFLFCLGAVCWFNVILWPRVQLILTCLL